jgi:pimeloyl-ACP methyl ester carboxylesterase
MKMVTLLVLLWVAAVAPAANIEREKRLASEIEDAILDGEPVTLQAGKLEFLSLYTEADVAENTAARGAAIILHGRGFHPDWADAINPLRVGLAERGWNTLSMQMPVLHKEAKYFDYVPILHEAFPRIEAGIEYLQREGNKKIVLIAHSCSFHMVNAWIKQGRFKNIDAFVGIGMGATDYRQAMVDEYQLDKIDVPVLDIYGKDDYPAVHRTAPARLKMLRSSGDERSAQIVVPGANHYFTDKGDELVEAVAGWLQKL